MTADDWLTLEDPQPLIDHVRGDGFSRRFRLLNCACARHLKPWFPDETLEHVIQNAELFADRKLTERTLTKWREYATSLMRISQPLKLIESRAFAAVITTLSTRKCSMHKQWDASEAFARYGSDFRVLGITDASRFLLAAIRDIYRNPFQPPPTFDPAWRTSSTTAIATQMYAARDFSAMPILADALEEAGCTIAEILDHCRSPEDIHVRGCWVVDLVLGKA